MHNKLLTHSFDDKHLNPKGFKQVKALKKNRILFPTRVKIKKSNCKSLRIWFGPGKILQANSPKQLSKSVQFSLYRLRSLQTNNSPLFGLLLYKEGSYVLMNLFSF